MRLENCTREGQGVRGAGMRRGWDSGSTKFCSWIFLWVFTECRQHRLFLSYRSGNQGPKSEPSIKSPPVSNCRMVIKSPMEFCHSLAVTIMMLTYSSLFQILAITCSCSLKVASFADPAHCLLVAAHANTPAPEPHSRALIPLKEAVSWHHVPCL